MVLLIIIDSLVSYQFTLCQPLKSSCTTIPCLTTIGTGAGPVLIFAWLELLLGRVAAFLNCGYQFRMKMTIGCHDIALT